MDINQLDREERRVIVRRAAELLARNELSIEEAAEQVGVPAERLREWLKSRSFARLIEEAWHNDLAISSAFWTALRSERVKRLQDIANRLLSIITEREKAYTTGVPGARSGLLAQKIVVNTRTGAQSTEWYVDTALVRELREVLKHIAIELGQWEETRQKQREAIIKVLSGFDINQL